MCIRDSGSRYHLRAACKVNEKAKWTPKSANTATVVYNSNANARYGQDGSQTPGVQTATTSAQVNRVELDCRPTADVVHTGTDIGRGTDRQSADANTGRRAATVTPAARTCNDVRTTYPTYIVPSCSDGNADSFDVDVDGLVSVSYTHLTLPTIYSV